MNILVIGGGGREHAIICKLKENPTVTTIYAAPGNGGIAKDAICIDCKATDIDTIVSFATANSIDFAVVAPDDPLAMGCVDRLEAAGIPAFGPTAAAARIEASKAFSKDLMAKYAIPTATYQVFTDVEQACAYLSTATHPIVIKADGLALGKGVVISQNVSESLDAVRGMMEDKAFGTAGNTVVIEEFLTGPEVSVLAFTDGNVVMPMVSSMDHKRAWDGDKGLNTGGMGTIAPNPYYTDDIAAVCMETIFLPTIKAMVAEGCPFKGCLYFGLMLTPNGPKVIEYNCRFGDPETQVVLPLLQTDLLTIMQAVRNETLGEVHISWKDESAACVIMASGGYPAKYASGKEILIPPTFDENVTVFHAGTKMVDGTLVTAGGRVLGVTATAPTLAQAIDKAYYSTDFIHFEDAHLRHDIGQTALKALEV
ncbi:phosphoribosylamine--glycine ligase [Bengtsoniella intestinalis]|uniref:phosphoribosylamine--glycine ligase n=1 Tax=Bengtsoniella intestinalis TaxID=3073143 RepID=UPI00391F8B71